MVSELDFAWTAGILDGDGTITLRRVSGGQRYRAPFITVVNTDREIIDFLIQTHGGSCTAIKKTSEHHRQAWSWRLYGTRRILAFLAKVHPYMRCGVKRERVRMLLEEYPQVTPRNGWYTDEDRAAKERFEDRFMALGEGRGWRIGGTVTPTGHIESRGE